MSISMMQFSLKIVVKLVIAMQCWKRYVISME
nr:MAG TPA: hypothetical protein [Caudoviricetes sp.]